MNKFIIAQENARDGVLLLLLNRPAELNALNLELMSELRDELALADKNDNVRVIVLSGQGDKAFAAGADIKQMADKTAMQMLQGDQFGIWDQIKKTKKPMIAAVQGFALGGGCELAMHCDMIVACENAKFGQPEVRLGLMPGAGGTQRLTRAIGKAKAMEIALTGAFFSAQQALDYGLINQISTAGNCLNQALDLAEKVAQMAPIAVRLIKESINRAYESHLEEGLHFERKNFYLLFASQDHHEGIQAFIEKRKPNFTGK